MVLNFKETYEINDLTIPKNIDYISDIHGDYYFITHTISIDDIKNNDIENFFNLIRLNSFNQDNKILIISGDISENNELTIKILNVLKKFYKYIVFIIGNHDIFITNRIEEDDYENNSLLKFEELKRKCKDLENIYLLDGGIITINGVSIGGTMGWYDGSYIYKYKNQYYQYNDKRINKDWLTYIDGRKIRGIKMFNEYFEYELEKLKYLVSNSNIVTTHFMPTNNQKHFNPMYLQKIYESMNQYFCFNGIDKLEDEINEKLKHWIYGHSHDGIDYEYKNIRVVNNCIGSWVESNMGKNSKFKEIIID